MILEKNIFSSRYNLLFLVFAILTLGFGVSQAQPSQWMISGTDSVLVFPAFISEQTTTGIQYKIPDIPFAEKQWKLAREENNKQSEIKALLSLSDAYLAHGKDLIAYQELSKILEWFHLVDEKSKSHFYYNCAVIFAHLENYPLAMACFQRTGDRVPQFSFKKKHKRFTLVDTVLRFNEAPYKMNQEEEDAAIQTGLFTDKGLFEIFKGLDSLQFMSLSVSTDSEPIDIDTVLAGFEDGKKAIAYALVLHTKQPVSGKKKVYTSLSNVGHMFVTLIKYNLDESVVCQTLGLYPQPGFLVSANPLFPKTEPLFKNDAGHSWDEMLGKFLDESSFNQLLDYISNNADRPYHLNSNNCSDFALSLAAIAGIEIENTIGSWPLGRGKNPGCTGQSILSGKFSNKETGGQKGLLAVTNHLFVN